MIRTLSSVAMITVLAFGGTAAAQQPSPGTNVSKKGSAQPTPVAAFWKRKCEGGAGTPLETCFIQQQVGVRGQQQVGVRGKQIILIAAFGLAGSERRPTAVLTTPLNVSLRSGLALKVDGKEQIVEQFNVCTRAGCRAIFPISDALLADMQKGQMLAVGWKSAPGQDVILPIRLQGFTAAWASLQD